MLRKDLHVIPATIPPRMFWSPEPGIATLATMDDTVKRQAVELWQNLRNMWAMVSKLDADSTKPEAGLITVKGGEDSP